MTIPAGTRFGRYEIRSQIGAGGMGVVYLAQDSQLERTVALKILPADVAKDEQRMYRFIQEAKAASALNHPNIITIYEIGHENSAHFISTEFIRGETLRHHINGVRIGLSEAIEVGTQVAAALSAAHTAGIVHRDIKPENIMLREDGYVKVLDFGLAKLTESSSAQMSADRDAPTQTPSDAVFITEPGMVMGTARYMSPEQSRGLSVDSRTDIWSLGVVLYELVTGHPPFLGATIVDTIAAILKTEPPPVTTFVQDAPVELQRIIRKTLRKDCDERYQTAKDLHVDLRSLRLDMELAAEIGRSGSGQAHLSAETLITRSGSLSTPEPVVGSSSFAASGFKRSDSTGKNLAGKVGGRKTLFALTLAVISVVRAVIGFGLYRLFWTSKPAAHFQTIKITRLTSNGKASDVSISPDGQYIVYVVGDPILRGLWVKHLATSSDVEIVPLGEMKSMGGTTFSNDSNYIFYVVNDKENPNGALYQVPVLGGTPKKLLVDLNSPVTFSPDGKQFAFVRRFIEQGEMALMTANANGTGERKIASQFGTDWFSENGPSWSPDGKTIACGMGTTAGGYQMRLAIIPVGGGTITPLGTEKWHAVDRVAWFDDGSGLVFAAKDQPFAPSQVWQLSYPDGKARRVTSDLGNYGSVSLGLTKDSMSLITVQADRVSNVWISPHEDSKSARQITSRGNIYDGQVGISSTPDGRIVYASNASGNSDIWIMNLDGTGQKQLTDDGHFDSRPVVTPDGRYIVFVSDRTGASNIWRMSLDGSGLKKLSDGKIDQYPDCSPDGQWVIYESIGDSGFPCLWKISVDGGAPSQVTDKWASRPAISPDGKMIAYIREEGQANKQLKLVVIQFEGGQPIKTFDFPLTVAPLFRWSPDDKDLVYVDTSNGVSNLWSMPLDGDKPSQLTDFKSDQIFYFRYSSDKRDVLFSRGTTARDVVLISDTK